MCGCFSRLTSSWRLPKQLFSFSPCNCLFEPRDTTAPFEFFTPSKFAREDKKYKSNFRYLHGEWWKKLRNKKCSQTSLKSNVALPVEQWYILILHLISNFAVNSKDLFGSLSSSKIKSPPLFSLRRALTSASDRLSDQQLPPHTHRLLAAAKRRAGQLFSRCGAKFLWTTAAQFLWITAYAHQSLGPTCISLTLRDHILPTRATSLETASFEILSTSRGRDLRPTGCVLVSVAGTPGQRCRRSSVPASSGEPPTHLLATFLRHVDQSSRRCGSPWCVVNCCKLSHNRNSEKGSSEKQCLKPQSQFTRKSLWLNYELVFVIRVCHEVSVSVNKKHRYDRECCPPSCVMI